MNLFRVMNTVPRTILSYEYSPKNNTDIFTTSLFQPLTLVKFFKSQGFLANTDISCNTLPVLTSTHVNNNIKITYQKQGFFNVVCSCKIICNLLLRLEIVYPYQFSKPYLYSQKTY